MNVTSDNCLVIFTIISVYAGSYGIYVQVPYICDKHTCNYVDVYMYIHYILLMQSIYISICIYISMYTHTEWSDYYDL